MRLNNAPAFCAPLLATAFSVVLGGCPVGLVDQPPSFSAAPTVVAIYAIDAAYGSLGDVLIYSATEPLRTSKAPASYGGFRVEFNQPMAGPTLAKNSDLGSFCSELSGGNSVTLVDAEDSNIGTIKSTVCYDPSSALGSNPNVLVIPGEGAAFAPNVNPFTCQAFSPEDGSSNPDKSGNVFKATHKYALKFATSKIQGGSSGKALTLPVGTGWTTAGFEFTTDDFSLMAFGYQDQTTNFFTLLEKPAKGFLKDLDTVTAAAFVVPADDTAVVAIFSAGVGDAATASLTRGDASSNDGGPADGGDPAGRKMAFAPGQFWESNGTYKVTLPKEIAGATGTLLGTDHTYTFKTSSAAPGVRSVTPSSGAVAVSIAVGVVTILTQEPVDPATKAGFVVKKAGTVIPGDVTLPDGNNHQKLSYKFTAGTLLDPNTVYTVEVKGLKVLAATPNASATIGDFSSTFTTATFRSSNIFNGTPTALDRSVGSSPTVLRQTSATNTLSVVFTNSPTAGTVSTSSVILGEVSAAGAFTPFDSSKYTVTAASPSATNKSFIIKITDAAYPLKFTQKYGVKLTTAITDSASGQPLKAEGCSASDCSEFRSFTTGTFAPTITITSRTTGAFKVAFNASVDPATLNPYVGSAYKLFKTNKDGSLDSTPIVMSCTPFSTVSPATTTTNCTTTSTLALDYTYVASATFLQTAVAGQSGPAHVAATISGLPTDAPTTTNGSTFFGSRTATFTTPCP